MNTRKAYRMKEIILKYQYFTLAILFALASLCIWYYILCNADYTLYPPLSVLFSFDRIPDLVIWLHYLTAGISLVFLVLSMVYREVAVWLGGVFLVLIIVIYSKITNHFIAYENYIK